MSSVRRWVLTHTGLKVAVHGVLLEFQLDGLSFRCSFAIVGVLACKPGLKLFVLAADKFQGFGHNVRRVRIKELCVPVKVESDVFLQADLECRSFRLF